MSFFDILVDVNETRIGFMTRFCILPLMALMSLMLPVALRAEQVSRDEAYAAAVFELPSFFAGEWTPAGDIPLHTMSGDVVAFMFMFRRTQKAQESGAVDEPFGFVEKARADIAGKGKEVSGYETELRGEDRFATIVISADDGEPPVIRCFRGLPPHVVRQKEALALAAGKGGGVWRVRRCLMLGFFDEAFAVEPAGGSGEALVVELRMRVVESEKEARARGQVKKMAVRDMELVRMCQKAWAPYRGKRTSGGASP